MINARFCPKHSASRLLTSKTRQMRPTMCSVQYVSPKNLICLHLLTMHLNFWKYDSMTLGILGTSHSKEISDYWVFPAQATASPDTGLAHSFLLLCQAHRCVFSGTYLYCSLQTHFVLSVLTATGLSKLRLQQIKA